MVTDEEIEMACIREFGTSRASAQVALYIARWMEKTLLIRMSKEAIVEKHEKLITDIDNILGLLTDDKSRTNRESR